MLAKIYTNYCLLKLKTQKGEEAKQYMEDGQFPPGSMGPKAESKLMPTMAHRPNMDILFFFRRRQAS